MKIKTIITMVLDIALAITCYFVGMSDGVRKERKKQELFQSDISKIATTINK